MCNSLVTKDWIVNHITETLPKKFHRRKYNRRAFNKFYKNHSYYSKLGDSVGISFIIKNHKKKPKLIIKRINQVNTTNTIDQDQVYYSFPVASAC
jgi:hypothetical protein